MALADRPPARLGGRWLRALCGSRTLSLLHTTVAVVMMTAVAQPSHRGSGELTRFHMTVGSIVTRMTSTINGAASTPLITADRNSMATALRPTKFMMNPTGIETATTAEEGRARRGASSKDPRQPSASATA